MSDIKNSMSVCESTTPIFDRMLNSYRIKDQVHLLDMIHVGLIDATWPQRFEPSLAQRLQTLIDNPNG